MLSEKYVGPQYELRSQVGVSTTDMKKPSAFFAGIWDTGASNSSVARKVVEKLGLEPVDVVQTSTANGVRLSMIYKIKIYLSGGIVKYVRATECNMLDVDVLIGMDIIASGDFAVGMDASGDTVLYYRTPSQGINNFKE